MAIDTTSTSGNPYFDDWSTSGNAAKNYLKILFQHQNQMAIGQFILLSWVQKIKKLKFNLGQM